MTKLPTNAAKVICSSLRHIFVNRGSTQSGVSFVLLSIIGILLYALSRHVFDGDAVTLNCRELQLNDPRSARAAKDDAGYTKGYFEASSRHHLGAHPTLSCAAAEIFSMRHSRQTVSHHGTPQHDAIEAVKPSHHWTRGDCIVADMWLGTVVRIAALLVVPSPMEDLMCWEMDSRFLAEQKKAQENRIKEEQRVGVIGKLLSEANTQRESTNATPAKEVTPAK